MDLVLGTHALGLGGSETYLITLAEQLQRLGHRVALTAVSPEKGAAVARRRGVRVFPLGDDDGVEREVQPPGEWDELPERCDGVVAQDGVSAFELARRYPEAPLVFVAHSEEFDEQLPPQIDGLVDAVVVLNDRVERRVRALAADFDVVRLRQPIDTTRFKPRSRLPAVPRRLLLFGNYAERGRLELVADVASEAGLELVRVGAKEVQTERPERDIDAADIVMGYGRCVLEGMACGRPAYVYDHLGGDGWVTPSTYPALEADGFGGRAFATVVDRARLLRDLRAYEPEAGLVNRDLVVTGHRAEHHAQEVVTLLDSIRVPRRRRTDVYGELARLVRAQWRGDARVIELEEVVATLNDQLAVERAERAAREAAHAAERAAKEGERTAVARHLDTVIGSRRYRIGAALARPLDAARALRRGPG